jgi:hypothetical protein
MLFDFYHKSISPLPNQIWLLKQKKQVYFSICIVQINVFLKILQTIKQKEIYLSKNKHGISKSFEMFWNHNARGLLHIANMI